MTVPTMLSPIETEDLQVPAPEKSATPQLAPLHLDVRFLRHQSDHYTQEDYNAFWSSHLIREFIPDSMSESISDPKTVYQKMVTKTNQYILDQLCYFDYKGSENIIDFPQWCRNPPNIMPAHFIEAFKLWLYQDPKKIVLSRLEKKLCVYLKNDENLKSFQTAIYSLPQDSQEEKDLKNKLFSYICSHYEKTKKYDDEVRIALSMPSPILEYNFNLPELIYYCLNKNYLQEAESLVKKIILSPQYYRGRLLLIPNYIYAKRAILERLLDCYIKAKKNDDIQRIAGELYALASYLFYNKYFTDAFLTALIIAKKCENYDKTDALLWAIAEQQLEINVKNSIYLASKIKDREKKNLIAKTIVSYCIKKKDYNNALSAILQISDIKEENSILLDIANVLKKEEKDVLDLCVFALISDDSWKNSNDFNKKDAILDTLASNFIKTGNISYVYSIIDNISDTSKRDQYLLFIADYYMKRNDLHKAKEAALKISDFNKKNYVLFDIAILYKKSKQPDIAIEIASLIEHDDEKKSRIFREISLFCLKYSQFDLAKKAAEKIPCVEQRKAIIEMLGPNPDRERDK